MALTKAQRDKYLKRHGIRCAYCDSEDLETLGRPISNDGRITQCSGCGRIWMDIYTLSDIEE